MNALIEFLNSWGDRCFDFAAPMLWQSSLLIAMVFLIDFALRRKMRAALRYALWMVVLVKLVLPPTLASPSAVSWWLRPNHVSIAPPQKKTVIVRYSDVSTPAPSLPRMEYVAPPPPKLSWQGTVLLSAVGIGALLFGWMAWRWWQITRTLRATTLPSDELTLLLAEARKTVRLRQPIEIRVTLQAMSPAVCGLFRPVVLLPACLTERLYPEQLRAVLLHELIHLKRRDVWMNCAQTLLQIVYWWHPLLWIANARIRRVREEAVDDAVMLALRSEADIYAPTLLEVAKLAFSRPLASLGIVGILESKNALRQRIERLLNFTAPRKAGLSILSLLAIAAFSAIAVPMGEARAPSQEQKSDVVNTNRVRQLIATKIQNGRMLYQLGKLDEAEVELHRALELSPTNDAASYYLALIQQARMPKATNSSATEKHEHSIEHSDSQFTSAAPKPHGSRQAIIEKLSTIRLDTVQFDNLPLGDVLRTLNAQAKMTDPEKKGIEFVMHPDLASVVIRMKAPLNNVPLLVVLDALVTGADKRITYSLLTNGVQFLDKVAEPSALQARIFKIDSETFLRELERVSRDPAIYGSPKAMQFALPEWLSKNGVDLTPPKTVFYSDTQGALYVRATVEELDRIEQALVALKPLLPQINLRAQFVEVDSDAWVATLFLLNSTNSVVPSAKSFTSLITEEQKAKLKKQLEKSGKADLLNDGQVTTLNGREAEFSVSNAKTVVIASAFQGQTNATPVTTNMSFGPMLDVVPTIGKDGSTIALTITAKATEFLGYLDPQVPKYRKREISTSATMHDGQTLVLGGFPEQTFALMPDGSAQQSQGPESKKQLLVLITATLVTPTGDRAHGLRKAP